MYLFVKMCKSSNECKQPLPLYLHSYKMTCLSVLKITVSKIFKHIIQNLINSHILQTEYSYFQLSSNTSFFSFSI